MGGGGGQAGLWGGETIEGLALPALGGAELAAPRPCSSAPLEELHQTLLPEHSAFLPTCPTLARCHFLQEAYTLIFFRITYTPRDPL